MLNREALIDATNALEAIRRHAMTGDISVVRRLSKEALDAAKKICDDDEIGYAISSFLEENYASTT